MAIENTPTLESFKAESDLSGSQYRIVVLGTNDGEADLPAATTDTPLGIVYDFVKGTAGESVTIATGGVAKCEANAAITKGAMVGIAATTGRIGAKTTAGDWIIGQAREAATAQGDLIAVKLAPVPFKYHG